MEEEQDINLPMKGDMPKTLLIHGDLDQVVLLEDAERFAEVVIRC
jgi:predicted esterase